MNELQGYTTATVCVGGEGRKVVVNEEEQEVRRGVVRCTVWSYLSACARRERGRRTEVQE